MRGFLFCTYSSFFTIYISPGLLWSTPMYNVRVKDCHYLLLDKALAETAKCRPPVDPYKTG